MNHVLIAILISLALPPQSDPQCQRRCDRQCKGVEEVTEVLGQDPDDVDTDDNDTDAEEAAELAREEADAAAEEAEAAAEEAQVAAEQAAEEAEEAAEQAAEQAEAAAEEAREVAERAAEEAVQAAEQGTGAAQEALKDAKECLERQLKTYSELQSDDGKIPQCVKDSLKTAQAQLRELVAAARSAKDSEGQECRVQGSQGQGSCCGKNKRAKELASAERALADLASVQGSQSYQRAMELAKDQGALAQVLAQKVELSEATKQQLEELAKLGYGAAVSFPHVSGDVEDEDAQSRSLEERIQALEQRLGVKDHDGRSLEKRVEELERMLEHSVRLERRGPNGLSAPRALVVPGVPGRTFVMPGVPSTPGARPKVIRGNKNKSKSPSKPGQELWETPEAEAPTPAPEGDQTPLSVIVPRTPQDRWRVVTPAPPSVSSPPSAPEAPTMSLRRPGERTLSITSDRRREIESMMQRMRDEMERLRGEMDRLREDLQSSARERNSR